MEPHQQRVVDEKLQLDEKLEKLNNFFMNPIFKTLNVEEQDRLIVQSHYMAQYSRILKERIDCF